MIKVTKDIELLHFYVDWSGANLIQMPEIEKLSKAMPELKIRNIDVEKDEKTAISSGVEGLPTILITEGGKVVSKLTGVYKFEEIKQEIDAVFSNNN